MDYLACYTIKDTVEEGISVDDFESVVVEDAATTLLKKAVLQMIPVMEPTNSKSLNSVAESSLCFLKEAGKRDKRSEDYVVIAVDPSQWKICYSRDSFGLIDPCGIDGAVLLLVRNGTKHVLVKANDRHTELSIGNDNRPVISKCNRASMLYEAAANRSLMKEISSLPTQCLLAAPKGAAKSGRS